MSALGEALVAAEARYKARHPKSDARHQFAAQHMPGANTRSALHYTPFPLTWASGKGNRLTDIDGLEYLDFLGEYSAGLYGHSNAIIQAAIKRAVDDGLVLGGPNLYEARLAEAIRGRFASIDLIRFTNSGTEANLMALAAVRALRPDRPQIIVFDGAYLSWRRLRFPPRQLSAQCAIRLAGRPLQRRRGHPHIAARKRRHRGGRSG